MGACPLSPPPCTCLEHSIDCYGGAQGKEKEGRLTAAARTTVRALGRPLEEKFQSCCIPVIRFRIHPSLLPQTGSSTMPLTRSWSPGSQWFLGVSAASESLGSWWMLMGSWPLISQRQKGQVVLSESCGVRGRRLGVTLTSSRQESPGSIPRWMQGWQTEGDGGVSRTRSGVQARISDEGWAQPQCPPYWGTKAKALGFALRSETLLQKCQGTWNIPDSVPATGRHEGI